MKPSVIRILGALAMAILLGAAGCASLRSPDAQALASAPVIEFGNPVPPGTDFILYFPAGKPIPVITTIEGTALSASAESTLNVFLKTDLYAYKEWVSVDRKVWKPGRDLLAFQVEVKVPGPEHPQPGTLKLKVDLK